MTSLGPPRCRVLPLKAGRSILQPFICMSTVVLTTSANLYDLLRAREFQTPTYVGHMPLRQSGTVVKPCRTTGVCLSKNTRPLSESDARPCPGAGEGVGLLEAGVRCILPEVSRDSGVPVGAGSRGSIPMKRRSAPERTRERLRALIVADWGQRPSDPAWSFWQPG